METARCAAGGRRAAFALFTLALALGLAAAPTWADGGLESIAAETAREEIARSPGVVLLDLYAEW